jgi:hypothetical protein
MDTSAAPQRLGSEPLPCEVAAFLSDLRRAQFALIDVLASAGTRLPESSRQLVAMSAATARMARQVFDAQRSVLAREAQFDAHIATIDAATALAAQSLQRTVSVAVKLGQMESLDLDAVVAGQMPHHDHACAQPPTSERQKVAQLAVEVLHSVEDVEAMRGLLEAAFASDEPDTATTTGALSTVLDQWWSRREREHDVVLADAHARRRVSLHLAMLEAKHAAQQHVCTAVEGADSRVEVAPGDGDAAVGSSLAVHDEVLDDVEPTWADDGAESLASGALVTLDGASLPSSWRTRLRSADGEAPRREGPLRPRRLTMAWTR